MARTYGKRPCYLCDKRVSTNGLAQASHGRAHVRRGEAVDVESYGGIVSYVTPERAAELLALPNPITGEPLYCRPFGSPA